VSDPYFEPSNKKGIKTKWPLALFMGNSITHRVQNSEKKYTPSLDFKDMLIILSSHLHDDIWGEGDIEIHDCTYRFRFGLLDYFC
jgi:hypothetical protein